VSAIPPKIRIVQRDVQKREAPVPQSIPRRLPSKRPPSKRPPTSRRHGRKRRAANPRSRIERGLLLLLLPIILILAMLAVFALADAVVGDLEDSANDPDYFSE